MLKENFKEILNSINQEILKSSSKNLIEDGIIDSITLVRLTIALEEGLNISIDPDDISEDNFSSVKKLWNLVNKYLKEKNDE